jgi:hypothetical protein
LPLLSDEQKAALKEDGFHGKYTLFTKEPIICHRTQAVLRLLLLDNRRYSSFIGGDDDGSKEQGRVNDHLTGILTKYSRQIIDILDELEQVKVEEINGQDGESRTDGKGKSKAEHRDVLLRRWKQIRDMVNTAVETLRA